MNVPMITMPMEVALVKVREYRAAIKADPNNKTYRTMQTAFRALARGQRIIDAAKAIESGGVNDKGLPKLAIARAHWLDCWFEAENLFDNPLQRRLVFSRDRWARRHVNATINSEHAAIFDAALSVQRNKRAKARVPIIPPALRPDGSLSNYSVLFEAEWRDLEPIDPFLLRHLGGTLYVVLAAWDLTPIEASIFGASRER